MINAAHEFRFSVIIPAYNCGRFLAEALESVLAQTLPAHEVIVVDDGSTDDTPAVAARFGERILYHRQSNRGVSAARNVGIDRATGDWLAFLDADDVWEREKLEEVAPVCRSEPRPAIVFTDYRTFGRRESTEDSAGRQAETVHRLSAELRAWDPETDLLVPFVSVMPSAAVVPAGFPIRFVEGVAFNEDAIFFNEIAALGPVRCVPKVLTRYRLHPASAQAKTTKNSIEDESLMQWATAREPVAPGTVARMFHTLAELTVTARLKRNWPQYWMLRRYCDRRWPAELPRPAVLTERVWPQLAYRLKDNIDRLRF